MSEETGRLDDRLAWARLPGKAPGVVFLPGFRSDMQGSKAIFLRDHCAARGQAFLRLDYSGHGESDGRFEDGTIGQWAADALALFDALTEGPQILVGSSMGGWIALLIARQRAARLAGLVGIAPAPDFTEALLWPALPPEARQALIRDGIIHLPSEYGEPRPSPARWWRMDAGNPSCPSPSTCPAPSASCRAWRTRRALAPRHPHPGHAGPGRCAGDADQGWRPPPVPAGGSAPAGGDAGQPAAG